MKKVLLCLAAFLMMFSCDDGDGTLQTISFQIPSIFEIEDEYYIFLSDKEGRLIDVAEVHDGSTVELRFPSALKTVTVNFFSGRLQVNGIERQLRSFTDVPAGKYIIPESAGTIITPSGYTMTLQNMPVNKRCVLSGADKQFTAGADTVIQGSVFLFPDGHRPVMACILDETGDASRYQFLYITENSKVTFDYNTATPLGTFDLELPSDDWAMEQTVYKDGARFPLQAYNQIYIKPSQPSPLRLYHASAFDTHHTYLRVLLNFIFYTNDYWGKHVPSTFEILEASGELTAETENGFTINTSGSADILQTGFNKYETIDGAKFHELRTVFLPFNSTITFRYPEIPESIISRFYPHGQNIPHLDGALITNFDTLTYQDYIKMRLETPEYFGVPAKPIQDNARSKSFAF